MKQKNVKVLISGLSIIILIGLIPKYSNAQKINKLIEKGEYEKAEQYCEKQKDENQKSCYEVLANAYFSKADYLKAAEFYAKTDISNEGCLKIADVYFGKEDYKKAAEFYAKTDKSNEGYLKIADAYFGKEDYDKAGSFYTKAFEGNKSKQNESYLKIADVYFEKEDYDKAAEFYAKTDKSNESYLKIADAYFGKEDYDKAGSFYTKAFEDNKSKQNEKYLIIADACFAKELFGIAEKYYKKVYVNDIDKLHEIFKKIADTYFKLEEYKKASELYAKANLKAKALLCLEKLKMTDSRDGKVYNIVKIGDQWWMAENLNYQTADTSWYYNNSPAYGGIYGRLYTWNSALTACPAGWHLPTEAEWISLRNSLGGIWAARRLKSVTGWSSPNTGATNSSGFSALPGGYRYHLDGKFDQLGLYGDWWSATENDATSALIYNMSYNSAIISSTSVNKSNGHSVRCIRD